MGIRLKYKSWKDINVDTFQKISKINTNATDGVDMLDSNVKLLSILCECSEDDIERLGVKEFTKLLRQISFLSSMPKVKVKDKYKINGHKYELYLTLQKMNVSQYIDFQNYYKEGNIVDILSVFLIPKGKKYGEYDIDEVKDDIRKMSVVDGYSICFFFTLLFQALTEGIGTYWERQIMKIQKQEKRKKK